MIIIKIKIIIIFIVRSIKASVRIKVDIKQTEGDNLIINTRISNAHLIQIFNFIQPHYRHLKCILL